jgi:predicted lipoprotein with Yx(FWY)xxD motif
MITLRRSLAITSIALLVSIFLAACGGTQPANTNTTTGNANNTNMGTNYQTTPAAMTPTAKATMGMQPTPTATSSMNGGSMTGDNGNMKAFIHTAFVMLNGKKVHVLTNNKGFLLYYYTKDAKLTSKCTGGCAMDWPPLLSPQGTMTITSSIMLPHKLTVHKTANGNQVFYDEHALYTYAGDMQAGQFNGRGMDMAWYLVGTTL